MLGRTLGHYTLNAKLGAGGMGEVYRARDERLGRDVALKVLPETLAGDPDRLARFEREARTVAGLSHPNIVTLFSIEEEGGVRFLTMELVDGQGLDTLVAPGGLPVSRVLELGIPLAEALAAAHQRGVVHRDLKPANVMVTPDGRVKVLDFGLAKLAEAGPEVEATQVVTLEAPISGAGQLLGTVPYMAPEQIRGEMVDARADLFALGVVLYELATGRRPFRGDSLADISSAILRDRPEPLREVRAALPRDLDRIVARCLEKDRERRFQTAKDVRNELEILLMEGVPAGPTLDLPQEAGPSSEVPSVAVLPFANRSRDEEDEYFSDGLADEILSVLAKIRGLRVAARTSSSVFKGKAVTIAEVGKALNVATVLEGSVRKAGKRVRIAVQLVKVADGYPLWSETYDRTLEDIFEVQDDIARSVVKELRTTLLGETPDSAASGEARAEVAAAARGRGRNPEAHRLYLQAKHLADRMNPDDGARVEELLARALDLDPENAAAWTVLARSRIDAASYGWDDVHEGFTRAREALDRALAIEPDLPEVQVILSRIRRLYEWDWEGAEAAARRALELAPGQAETLREVGALAQALGRLEEAEPLLRRAAEQDPLSAAAYSQLGYLYRAMGRRRESVDAYRKSLELAPQRVAVRHALGLLLAEDGRFDEALAECDLEPAAWARLTARAIVLFRAGRTAEAAAAARELEEEHAGHSAIQLAAVAAVHGDADAAFAWLDRGFAQRDPGLGQLKVEPTVRSLHRDPRWPALLRRVGLPV